MSGPLAGIRVLELGGKGPTPFAGMMFADMGAEVVALDRLGADRDRDGVDVLARGKARLHADLRAPEVTAALLTALADFDVLIEGFRPGVAERIGLGPDAVHAINDRLVYGRMTGYGQGNSSSSLVGHDLNFIAMSTALAHIGPADRPPVVPLNLAGDFGGGAMFLVAGVLAALVERVRSGRGQVVDAAMTDGSALLMASVYGLRAGGLWHDERESNYTDGGAPFYGVYRTADDRFVSIGALEPRHWNEVLRVCGVDPDGFPPRDARDQWPAMRARLETIFSTRDRDAWVAAFDGVEASFAPVLTMDEAAGHPYHRERGTFPTIDGARQPAAAPRFDRTPAVAGSVENGTAASSLRALGVPDGVAEELVRRGVVA